MRLRLLPILAAACLPATALAQSISYTGAPIAPQSFDTLAATGTGTALPDGWAFVEVGSGANGTYLADAGGTNSGNTYSYGAAGQSERALGSLASGSVSTIHRGASLTNATGATLTSLEVAFRGEQWRRGAATGDRLTFAYSTDASSLTSGTWTAFPALDFPSPRAGSADSAVDGNQAAAQVNVAAVLSGFSVAPGATLWVRWTDVNDMSSDDGLAIDDVRFGPAGDFPPTLVSTVPVDAAQNVAPAANVVLNFSEGVDFGSGAASLACTSGGQRVFVATGNPAGTQWTLDPSCDFIEGDHCVVTLSGAAIVDRDGTPDPVAGNPSFAFDIAVDVAPGVASTVPADGAAAVAAASNLSITFTEPVALAPDWFLISCADSGTHAATVGGGPMTWTLNPSVDFTAGETCTVTIESTAVTDLDGDADAMAADHVFDFTISQGAGDYYASVDASNPSVLRASLHALIDDHQVYPYTGSPVDVWTMLEAGDEDPNDPNRVLDVYFNKSFAKVTDRDNGTNVPQGTRYNREHTWPQSLGFASSTGDLGFPNAPRSDAHMLYASEKDWNADRGNKPFADCPPPGCASRHTLMHPVTGGAGSNALCDHAAGNCNWVQGPDGNTGSFEVWTPRKGDVARAVLYMDVRYEGGVAGPGSNTPGQAEPDLVVTDNRAQIVITSTSPAYMGLRSTLIAWHFADPPDARERLRNDVIQSFQGNRNPFIDHPEWVACLYQGNCTAPAPVSKLAAGVCTVPVPDALFENGFE